MRVKILRTFRDDHVAKDWFIQGATAEFNDKQLELFAGLVTAVSNNVPVAPLVETSEDKAPVLERRNKKSKQEDK